MHTVAVNTPWLPTDPVETTTPTNYTFVLSTVVTGNTPVEIYPDGNLVLVPYTRTSGIIEVCTVVHNLTSDMLVGSEIVQGVRYTCPRNGTINSVGIYSPYTLQTGTTGTGDGQLLVSVANLTRFNRQYLRFMYRGVAGATTSLHAFLRVHATPRALN